METLTKRSSTILRFSEKKLGLLLLIFVAMGCQTSRFDLKENLNEKARVSHAKELLKNEYHETELVQLEGDKNIKYYISDYIAATNKKLNSNQMTDAVLKVSQNSKYDPIFLLAVIKTESQFNPLAIGTSGEIGLMQIKPSTAEWICKKTGFPWKGAKALKDPVYNIQVGAIYFQYLKKSLKSRSAQHSAHYINAYNMGINNLMRLPASSQVSHPYFSRVIQNYIDIYEKINDIKSNFNKS